MIRIGIIGTGFIAAGLVRVLQDNPEIKVVKVLSRRPLGDIPGFDSELLTNSRAELADASDLIVEVSGDPIYATEVLDEIARAGQPIVTMDSELQVTTGSHFVDRAYFTEADGDQPGSLARLAQEARSMGCRPLAYVNIKGYLNTNPTREDMAYWAAKQRLSLEQVVSFTDGTKLQIEQALVANGLGADIAQDGLIGERVDDLKATDFLADLARLRGRPISDYVISPSSPAGVFLLVESHECERQFGYGAYDKLRTAGGRAYLLLRPYHLCHMEIPRTIVDVAADRPPLLNNGTRPRIGVGAVAKGALRPGQLIERALGGFEARGLALSILNNPDHVPIGLLANAVLRRAVEPDQLIGFDDVDLPPSRALEIYLQIRDHAIGVGRPAAEPVGPALADAELAQELLEPVGNGRLGAVGKGELLASGRQPLA